MTQQSTLNPPLLPHPASSDIEEVAIEDLIDDDEDDEHHLPRVQHVPDDDLESQDNHVVQNNVPSPLAADPTAASAHPPALDARAQTP